MKKTLNAGLIVLTLVACGVAVWMLLSYFQDREPVDYEVALVTPEAGTTVSSPLTIAGKAHDNWFFNNEFPVEVRDANDVVIGQAVATRQPDVESEDDFYDFTATIAFTATPGTMGTLVLKRSNPEGKYNNYRANVPIAF
jgi:hypothetical protein